VPADCLLGPERGGFTVAQVRLGGGRIHHAMRTVGAAKRVFDMLCERAVSRRTKGEPLADKQLVQQMVADSWVEIEQFRLLVLHTAWKIDQGWGYKAIRADISAVKVVMAKLLHDVTARALQVHGSLGVTNEMPFMRHLLDSFVLGLADGPTEVHKVTVARQVLGGYKPAEGLFPSVHGPAQLARAREKYATVLGRHGR
jgi:acyl-CoA dehydrogenase